MKTLLTSRPARTTWSKSVALLGLCMGLSGAVGRLQAVTLQTGDILVSDSGTNATNTKLLQIPVSGTPPITPAVVTSQAVGVETGGAAAIDWVKLSAAASTTVVYYYDGTNQAIYQVDPATGNRSTISSGASTPQLTQAAVFDMIWDPTGNRLLISYGGGTPGIVTVNVSTGARAFLTGNGAGGGIAAPTVNLRGLAVADNGTIYMYDQNGLVSVNGSTGNRTLVSAATNFVSVASPGGIGYDNFRNLILVCDSNSSAATSAIKWVTTAGVITVATGGASSGAPGSGTALDTPKFPVVDGSGNLYYRENAGGGSKNIIKVASPGASNVRSIYSAAANYSATTGSNLTVIRSSPPSITSALTASGTYNTAISTYTITASGSPTSYNATGLPAGLSINPSNGQITGTPTDSGTFNVTISATNGAGTGNATLVFSIAPVVTSVTSSTANGTKKIGDSVSIQVAFSSNVNVTGTPTLTLETGTTDRTVNYASGSGGSTLTFTYTVQAGDTSADLDYVATSSLALSGGTIRDTAVNNAVLTLASPGAANSLGNNKALVIDGVAPTVSSVNSSTANGTYKAGGAISIQVNFSEAVTVTGTPQLTLKTGTTDRAVNYASGSGTSTLTFTYTVQAGDTSADLDYVATNSLALNGGTIQDAAGNAATLTLASPGAANSLGNNKALVIDGVAPTVSSVNSSTANGSYKAGDALSIQVNFSEAVTVTGTPQLTLETGATDEVVNYASGSGTSTLTFTYTVQAGDTSADLDYVATNSLALNGGTIEDAAGNAATLTLASPGAANSLGANKALVIDTTAPGVSSVNSSTADGSYGTAAPISIQVNFNEAVTVTGTPQLTLETGTTDRAVNYASGSGTSTLTFTYTVQAGDTSADLDYVATNSLALNGGTIRDTAGNDATLTLASPGAANSLGANKALVIDTTAPTVSSVNSSTANGTYKVGDAISIQVNFSEAVTVTGTPQLTLETGATDRVVNYASGSGTSALTFTYTVQVGDTSADLDYVATNSLALNGGTITDTPGNAATLTLASPGAANSLGANKALVVDGVAPTVSGVNASTADGSYKAGDAISIQVNFSEAVTVTGTPQLTLETGTTDRAVNYASGSGTSTLTFTYTVQAGDTSSDLDYVATSSLALNGGTIKDAAGNDATLTLASPGAANSLGANKALVIDTTVPTVSGITSSTANGSYKAGDAISIQVNFSEAVTVTGTPQLTLETGATDEVVNYASGSGTSTLTFTYTVQAGDTSADLDYVATNSLALNGGTIKDTAGNDATLTLASPGAANSLGANKALVIDTTAPGVSSVNSSTADGSYGTGAPISIQVNFNEAVTVTGTPQLTLETGTTDRAVNYASGSGTSTLTFTYTVQAGDTSADLDYVATGSLALNGGTIKDTAGNDATLTLASPGAANSLGANKALVIDTTAPTVSSVNSSTANGTYKVGDAISIQVNFSEAVTVTGTPQLTLETGATDRVVNYASGSGTSALTFTYTVQVGDASADLDYVATNSLALNGGTITDTPGNAATLTLASPGAANSLGANKALVVDGVAPTVSSVNASTVDGSYKAGNAISIQVNFSEAVTVTGTPQLTLETGATDRVVNYASGSGTSTLTFTYTVQAGDTSSDLDYVATNSLALNAGTIKDTAGNDATLTLASPGAANSLGANKALVIDTTAPTVSGVTSSTADGSYKAGDAISIQVNFGEAVTVTGTPQLTLETGATDRTVNYVSGSGTSALTFTYTVQAGDTSADLDYVATGSLALNGGTIKDTAGNDATLTLASPGAANSLGANKALVIDTTAPGVSSVNSSTANGTYKAGDALSIQVNFNEAVTVTGTPQLTLETGTTDRAVNYASGSGTSTLTFTYTVQVGDTSADLDYVATGSLALNGGTIKDAAGNDATLTLASPGAANSLGANKALVIDTTAPTVSSVNSSTANGTYKVGDAISIQVNFSEAVTVTGTPQLTLETGATDRVVNYASGSGTSALTFTYTVQVGDASADLDYVATNSLALNGGAIKDAVGNDATLALASPGAANSLGANKALVVDGIAPTVSSVNASTADGSYKTGDAISIQVNFGEAVTVTGTPQLTLETGATDRAVNYASGSGTSTLTFTYTVQAGDTSSDLDYVATSSLALNGGTMKDAAGNDATLTLASPGAANSLGANKALVIDTTVPTVSGITSSTANGSYKAGDAISIQVNFSENITVTGTPQLTLETGTTDRVVDYVSGSGTSTLTFTYTVQAGDASADLDYVATNSLALNGGTIKDTAGNDATLTLASPGAANSLGANKALVIDTVVPTVSSVNSSTANATYKIGDAISLQVNFSENVTVTGTPQLTLETGATDRVIGYVSGSGTSTLTFTYTVQAGDTTADLDYVATGSLALNGGTIKDAAGNDATLTLASPGAANSLGANKALVIDGIAPTVIGVTSSTANGVYLAAATISIQVNFSDNVTVTGTPQLTLETGATDRVVNYASGSGTGTLTFTYTVQAGDNSTDLDYVATTSLALNGGTIKDAAGNAAVLTLASPGAANSLGANKAIVVDTTAPTVSGVTSSTANGSYNAGDAISIQVNFSEVVTVTGTPQLTLETGATDRAVDYTSGSGTSSLTFTYTVQAGDTSADLDYVATNSLALNGGTIKDGVGNNATLTLASPGAANSLGANQALVIDTTAPTLQTILRQTPATVNTNAATVTWRVTFQEGVTGVDANDFVLTVVAGTPSGTITGVTPVSAVIYDVAVGSLAGQGRLRLDLKATGAGIADLAGNALADGGFTAGDFYYVGVVNVFDATSLATGTTRSVSNATTAKVAQRFTTAATAPLSLTTVSAALGAITGTPVPQVTIHADAAGAIDPTVVATLTNPASLTANALNVWTSTALLPASTTYWVVFADTSVAGAFDIKETAATTGGSGAWLTNPDYAYRYGVSAGTGPQAGALQIAIGATSVPSITSTLTASGTYKTAFTYTITATNLPTSYAATGLPVGLSLNTGTGTITGAATQTGVFNVSLTGTNGSGTGAPSTLVLTVAQVPLTVTALAAQRPFGAANPTLVLDYNGFIAGDYISDLTVAPTAATTAGTLSPVGTYAITVAGGVSSNYTFSYVPGVLSVVRAAQVITFSPIPDLLLGQATALNAAASSGLPVTFSVVTGPATVSGGTVLATGVGSVSVQASQAGDGNYLPAVTEQSFRASAGTPALTTPAHTAEPAAGGTAVLSGEVVNPNVTFQWQRNGADLTGATNSTLTLNDVQPPVAGLYTYTATLPGGGSGVSEPVIVGLTTTEKVIGAGEEIGSNIVHPNGNVYDQLLLEGPATTFTANPNQITRLSFIDLTDDIVQVEFSGAGAVSLVMDGASAPAPAVNYNQPGVNYVKGHAGIVIVGANETSNLSIISVGRINAVNQALFRNDVTYDGIADIAFVAIQSANGKFGGLRTGNVNYFATQGFTGVYAPGVQFMGPVYVGDINAFDAATPVLVLGAVDDARITGGSLLQPNTAVVKVSGLTHLRFVNGTTSHGVILPAQANRGRLVEDGVDITDLIVVNP